MTEEKQYFVEPRKLGYGKEYSVYHGTPSNHARGMSDWINTVKTKTHAKNIIEHDKQRSLKEHELPHWDKK